MPEPPQHPALSADDLAAALPRYTAIVGSPGTSTTELLAQLAGRLSSAPHNRQVILLDPKGDACYMVARHIAQPARLSSLMIVSGWPGSLALALGLLANAGPGCDLLIDNTHSLTRMPEYCDALVDYLRTLRAHDHRVVLQVHLPADLPRRSPDRRGSGADSALPPPDLFCAFPTVGREWEHAYPDLAAAGAFANDPARGAYGRCLAINADATVRGVIDVGPEPDPRQQETSP